MNQEERDKELDEWLDRATAEYGRVEIRPGFEDRILAGVKRRQTEHRRRIFYWMSAAAAVALLLVFSSYRLYHHHRIPEERAIEVAAQANPVRNSRDSMSDERKPVAPVVPSVASGSVGNSAARTRREQPASITAKKRPGFLAGDLTEQERLLIAFVRALPPDTPPELSVENFFEPFQLQKMDLPEFKLDELEFPPFQLNASTETIIKSEEKS
jgi:hypothetical protein